MKYKTLTIFLKSGAKFDFEDVLLTVTITGWVLTCEGTDQIQAFGPNAEVVGYKGVADLSAPPLTDPRQPITMDVSVQ